MRIVVAGWHGQLAHELSALAAARHDVTAFAVARPALDLCDSPSVGRTVFGIAPDIIINTAAYTDVEGAEAEPARAFRLNTVGAASLAAQAAKIGIPIIQLSTGHIFDGEKAGAYCEDDDPGPLNVYGRSKLESERAVADANPRHIILRTTWIHSPYGRNFVKSILREASRRATIDVVDDEIGSPTYARDLAAAILDIATMVLAAPEGARWGTYHVAGTGGGVSWYGFAQQVIQASRLLGGPCADLHAIKSRDYGAHAARPRNSCLDCSRLQTVFGLTMPDWRPAVDDCVRRLLAEPVAK